MCFVGYFVVICRVVYFDGFGLVYCFVKYNYIVYIWLIFSFFFFLKLYMFIMYLYVSIINVYGSVKDSVVCYCRVLIDVYIMI